MERPHRLLLLVGGEEALLFGLKAILQSPVIEIDSSRTMDEALDLLRNRQYKVVLTDWNFNKNITADLETIETIKRLQPQCKIIVFTPFAEGGIKESAVKSGVDLFFEEPRAIGKIKEYLLTLDL